MNNAKRRDWALSSQQRAEARAVLELLEGSGLSPLEAARQALGQRAALKRVRVSEAVEALLLEVARSDLREATKLWHEHKLRPVQRDLGEWWIDEVAKADLRAWLQEVTPREGGRRHYARALRRLWRWALAQEEPLVTRDVTMGLVSKAKRVSEVFFLPVEDCARLLAGAGRFRNAVALALFTGIRPEELGGIQKEALLWRHVLIKERMIRVPAAVAKMARPRVMEGVPETVWQWLQPGEADERICPVRAREIGRMGRTVLGMERWPADCLRHTFATYHVAAFNDPGKASLLLGHEGDPGLLHQHYRGLTTQAEAERFWALSP